LQNDGRNPVIFVTASSPPQLGNVGVETCPRIWKFIESIVFQLLDARGIRPRSAKDRP
jgi:hypothetical protein